MSRPRFLFADVMNKSEGSSNSLAILCIAAAASRHPGVNVCIDSFAPGLSPYWISERIRDWRVELVGFSVNALNEHAICEVIACLRAHERSPYVVVGGPSASHSPRLSDVADFVVYGEGEDSIYDLATAFAEGGQTSVLDGEVRISGISGRLDDAPVREARLSDLSRAPSPLVPSGGSVQFLPVNGTSQLYWETTRGCSYNCAFCCYSLLSSRFRPLPQERLSREVRFFMDSSTEHLFVTDSVLGGQRKRTKVMLQLLGELPMRKSVRLRGEYVDSELAELLYGARVWYLDLGLQTTNPALSWARSNDIEAVLRSLSCLRDAGVKANLDLIIGFPGETIDTMRESVRFVVEDARPNSMKIFPLKVYPGTAIERMARSKGSRWLSYDAVTCETERAFSFGSREFAELISYSNATAKLYRFLSQRRGEGTEGRHRMVTYDRFYCFLKRQEARDMDAFMVLHMPQNSHATESLQRLWRAFRQEEAAR